MSQLADQLGARPQFKADGFYELEEMLTSVLKRTKELWTKAAESAKSWSKSDKEQIALDVLASRETHLSSFRHAASMEREGIPSHLET
jgi:hypothetical protein